SLVEILQRESDRLASKNVADRVLERDQLRTGACLHDRVIPRAIDVGDAAERAPARVPEQLPWQRRRERGFGAGRRRRARLVRESIARRRATAEAGKEKREKARDVGRVRHVGAGEILAALDRTRLRTGPVLAQE